VLKVVVQQRLSSHYGNPDAAKPAAKPLEFEAAGSPMSAKTLKRKIATPIVAWAMAETAIRARTESSSGRPMRL
jgi:hypothetical protein